MLDLSDPVEGCPLGPCYFSAPPIVHRVLNGMAALDGNMSERNAFPGGMKAVDVACTAIVRRAENARDRSDQLHREEELAAKRAEAEAARAGRT